MEFCEFRTAYQAGRRRVPELRDLTVDEFYFQGLRGVLTGLLPGSREYTDRFLPLLGQWNHYRVGRPYCKVWPGMAAMLANTGIDIPCEEFRPRLPVFELRLPKTGNPLQETPSSPALRSLLVV